MDAIVAAIQGEDVNTEIRVHVIVLIIRKNHTLDKCWYKFGNLSELKLLTLCLHLFQLVPPPLLLRLCIFFGQTMSVSFSYRLFRYSSQLILSCMDLLQVGVHLLLSLVPEY